jgi:hypothetical protein
MKAMGPIPEIVSRTGYEDGYRRLSAFGNWLHCGISGNQMLVEPSRVHGSCKYVGVRQNLVLVISEKHFLRHGTP